jgi:hypothetical protein
LVEGEGGIGYGLERASGNASTATLTPEFINQNLAILTHYGIEGTILLAKVAPFSAHTLLCLDVGYHLIFGQRQLE